MRQETNLEIVLRSKTTPRVVLNFEKRAIDGTRTRDIQDHNPVLYQLSYDRRRRGRIAAEGAEVKQLSLQSCLAFSLED
jgi:hypothetical protein